MLGQLQFRNLSSSVISFKPIRIGGVFKSLVLQKQKQIEKKESALLLSHIERKLYQ